MQWGLAPVPAGAPVGWQQAGGTGPGALISGPRRSPRFRLHCMTPGNNCTGVARQGQSPEAAFVQGEEIPRVGNDRGE